MISTSFFWMTRIRDIYLNSIFICGFCDDDFAIFFGLLFPKSDGFFSHCRSVSTNGKNYFKCKFYFFSFLLVWMHFFFHRRKLFSAELWILVSEYDKNWNRSLQKSRNEIRVENERKCNQRKGIKWDFKSNMYHFEYIGGCFFIILLEIVGWFLFQF